MQNEHIIRKLTYLQTLQKLLKDERGQALGLKASSGLQPVFIH